MAEPFTASRPAGRSDKRVVFDLVKDADPETTFKYDDLKTALEADLDVEVGRDRIYRAVQAANKVLLREERRVMSVVRGVGYRVARADEHVGLSMLRKGRAETQLAAGVDLLRQVRYDELNDAERQLAEGTLLVFDGFYRAIKSSENRHNRQEETISALTQRIENLEKS